MRHIVKGPEPEDFTLWKKTIGQPGNDGRWDDLRSPEKVFLKAALLRDQGYVCCYCEQCINNDPSCQIEHIKPQGQDFFPEERFDYQNLLGACDGGTCTNPIALHCGQSKGDWYDENLFVSPLNPECSVYFRFLADGQVAATLAPGKRPAARETIDRLKLGAAELAQKRRQAILPALDPHLNKDDLLKYREHYRRRDEHERCHPFGTAIVYILEKRLEEKEKGVPHGQE